MSISLRRAVLAALAFCGPLVLYLRTLAPTVSGGDSAELTTGAAVLGIVHAPGAPFYLLVAHLFTWLPLGDIGYRVNLLSAFAAAGTCFMTYCIVRRLHGAPWQSLGAACLLGSTYYFWVNAVVAEVYALHSFFVGVLIWLAIRWRQENDAGILYAFAVLFGLGLGAHLSLIVMAPGFFWLLAVRPAPLWRSGKRLAVAGACLLLGASVYLYLPIRAAAAPPFDFARLSGVDLTTFEGFWWMISGKRFGALMFGVPAARLPDEVWRFVLRLMSNFVALGVVLGLIGVGQALRGATGRLRRRTSVGSHVTDTRAIHLGLGLLFLGHLTFVLPYNVNDKALMLGPVLLLWTVWTALGAKVFVDWLAERLGSVVPAGGLLMAMCAVNLVVNFPLLDLSADRSARQFGINLLDKLPRESTFIGNWVDVPILSYLQIVEGERPDVDVHSVFFLSRSRAESLIEEKLAVGQPVLSSIEGLVGESLEGVPVAECECFRVQRRD